MKNYDEMYHNVLRRRDEQLAKRRRRIAVAGSAVLPAVMLTAAVGVGVAALQVRPDNVESDTELGGASAEGNVNVSDAEALLRVDVTKPPVKLVDGRVILTEHGIDLDITDGISEDKPYIGEGMEPETGMRSLFVIGGTPEDYGWARFVMCEKNEEIPELSKWNCYSCNTFTADMQDRKWYETALEMLCDNPENTGILQWSMTERTWELVQLEDTVSGVVSSWDSLDGYVASMELIGVTHEPVEGENYYTAERVVLSVTDPEGRTAAVTLNSIDPIYRNVTGKLDTDENGELKGGVKLWAMELNGEKRYMVSLSFYSEKSDEEMMNVDPYGKGGEVRKITYPTIFFGCDPENLADGTLTPYEDGCVYSLTDSFGYDSGTTFVDENREFVMMFNPDKNSIVNSYELSSKSGGYDRNYGYSVGLTLYGLTHIPEFDDEDYYAAEDAKLYIHDDELGLAEIAFSQLENTPIYDEFVKNLNASHTDDCVTLLRLNDNGKEHYVIMLRNYHGENDQPYYNTVFFEFDPENLALIPYEANKPNKLIPTTPTVAIESRNGTDVLVTEKADKNDLSYVNTWDYVTACCNKVIGFDHENHTVFYLPNELGIIE